ncbi:Cleft lip and palate associated transmembrane protein 1 [Coemansia sp. RSA 353]|nr:Cleft lip and palate associated transmembrane protein 1 [Coemansia sp. RSA 788]KAJ2201036.1 Cleft lip and palate associated transmembrane protein 1 [Coemansia sp. RSA 522]KAJ2208965.1 Cleft lip and palate associated transmembrane protein 1 [Coemansia sp. RSA 521]KAJ2301403.1 Cleft lip and palate associated transmembrane protein 1 [Coemansia sp. RSA 353]
MAGRTSKVLSAAIVVVFGWYMLLLVRLALQLFYPATHIPLLKPLRQVAKGTPMHGLAWQEPFEYEVHMYVSPLDTFNNPAFFNTSVQVWHVDAQSLEQRYPQFSTQLSVDIPDMQRVANSTALYAFLFVQRAGPLNLNDPLTAYARAPLLDIRLRTADRKHSLLENGAPTAPEPEAWVPHGKTRLSWEIVLEDNRFPEWTMPLDIAPYLRINRSDRSYVPLVWENPLAVRAKHWTPLTSAARVSPEEPLQSNIEIETSLRGIGLGWLRLCNIVHNGLLELRSPRALIQYGESDVDNLKEMIHEINPTMLAITFVAMALHVLFEFLAYKEDVAFWMRRGPDSLHGVSRSSIIMGVASAWISLLYMWDRRAETNVVVLFGAAIGAVVEVWKASKVLRPSDLWLRAPAASDAPVGLRAQVQRDVDRQTAWWMARVCAPLLAAYAAFSLLVWQHESYVSWLLSVSLVSVYSLEFIQMWPQLLINHRLQSVDMLPLAALLFRFLTTFIDDLYALVVPMPLIERIGTLRDDVVFVILCYQWYKFPRRKDGDASEEKNSNGNKSGKRTPKKKKTKQKLE